MINNPNDNLNKIANIIKLDQITAKNILSVANSAYYNRSNNSVNTVEEAILRIGTDATLEVLLALNSRNMFDYNLRYNGFSALELWKRSVVDAIGAKTVSTYVIGSDRQVAYFSGLFSDIGINFLYQFSKEKFIEALVKKDNKDSLLIDEEKQVFNYSHDLLGADILGSWELPESFVYVAKNHHQIYKEPENEKQKILLYTVRIGKCMLPQIGYSDMPNGIREEYLTDALNALEIPKSDYDDFIEKTAEKEVQKYISNGWFIGK